MKNVLVRSLSGIIYIVVFVGCILGGFQCFFFLNEFLIVAGTVEYLQLVKKRNNEGIGLWNCICVLICAVLLSCAVSIFCAPSVWFGLSTSGLSLMVLSGSAFVLGAIVWVFMLCHAVLSKFANALSNLAQSLLCLFYITLPLSLLYYIYGDLVEGRILILITLIGIWINDTGAFCVGCSIGKHRLCERLSPKKSWEGFYGGLGFVLLAAVIYACICNYNVIIWIIYGIFVSILATFGDLFESMLKRTAGVKDSGRIIPGHGGILDRIDSFLFVIYALFLMTPFLL